MLAWNPLIHHSSSWATGGDLWGIYRGAHYVGWGYLGGIYTPNNGIITFPGIAVLLSPIAMLTGKLHMTESYMPFMLPHPSAALVLQPIELLLGSTVLYAADALAERVRVPSKRRVVLCLVIAVVAWPVVAVWGHAEDLLAMTSVLYAMVAMFNQKWAKCGWLLGIGIVMQPLAALILPLFLGATPTGKRFLLACRSIVLSALLVGVAFLGDASNTYRALVKQPTPPSTNHATPWAAIAPKLVSAPVKLEHAASLVPGLGHPMLTTFNAKVQSVVFVAGGPGRSIDVLIALLGGVYVWRRPQDPIHLLWLMAAVLASRCLFEAVMTPYYLAPPLILAMVVASRQGHKRFYSATVLALEITVFAYHHLSPWAWWLPVVTGMAAVMALGYPNESAMAQAPLDMPHTEPIASELDRQEPIAPRSLEPAL
jgi:hypothetical protein